MRFVLRSTGRSRSPIGGRREIQGDGGKGRGAKHHEAQAI